jgi:hypothetical protein
MPLDYEGAIYSAVLALLRANSGVTSTFRAGNIRDELTTAGPARKRLAGSMPVDIPSLDVDLMGGDEQATRTPHFGLTGPAATANCDAIVPVTVTLRLRMRFRGNITDETAALSVVRQALHASYPKLGLAYVRDFQIRSTRKPKAEPNSRDGDVSEVTWTVPVTCRLRTSQLR